MKDKRITVEFVTPSGQRHESDVFAARVTKE